MLEKQKEVEEEPEEDLYGEEDRNDVDIQMVKDRKGVYRQIRTKKANL